MAFKGACEDTGLNRIIGNFVFESYGTAKWHAILTCHQSIPYLLSYHLTGSF